MTAPSEDSVRLPPFIFQKIPPHFRVMQPLGERQDIRLACICGEAFDLSGQQRHL